MSAFGGIVAFDAPCTVAAADAMRDVFTEVVIAPGYDAGALAAFGGAPEPPGRRGSADRAAAAWTSAWSREARSSRIATSSRRVATTSEVVSSREPTEDEWRDLLLAWTIAWRVKSNTIVLVRDGATVGIGAGQMSRVDASWIATRKAGDRAKGASLASDAFFPFPDALEVAGDAGATAVIHPGGSKGDDAVLEAAEERGMAVVLTGRRHFRH